MKKVVAVIGDAFAEPGSEKYRLAYETGKLLVDNGFRVQSGGMGGVMRALCEGAHASEHYTEGDTIGILPSFCRDRANEFVDIVIPTGIDIVRNAITGNADAVIALGGGAGTLSEIAFSWTLLRLIVAYRSVPGWGRKLADTRIDARVRYPEIPEDRVYGADTPEEAIAIIKEKIDAYTKGFDGISGIDPRHV